MSIEVDWGTATSGPDREALAERIRSFIHDKFQQVALPRFIRSVQVHSFDFGTTPPDLEIKDFCEPFADFYEEDEDDDTSVSGHSAQWHGSHSDLDESPFRDESPLNQPLRDPFNDRAHPATVRPPITLGDHLNPHFLPRTGTPGIPGGTSTLGYHLMSLGGLSGTQTPLTAVAGGTPFASGWSDSRMMGPGGRGRPPAPAFAAAHQSRPEADIDDSNPTSRPSTSSMPPSHLSGSNKSEGGAAGSIDHGSHPEDKDLDDPTSGEPLRFPRMRERRPEDFQILCHVKYAGDVHLSLTAEILLDYPMPSFMGLPLKLNVTGITFDGVAVVAYIRNRVHFCFLSSEDADALVGSDQQDVGGQTEYSRPGADSTASAKRQGGLLQEIRVESEIGRKEDGKQALKNVGKVERFVLAQVRRIFEEEFIYPSFWTFLV
ncbi:mitochondrial distribution and morphology protein 12 [Aspergillus heteromorphus CBS 117.55]|uniref:Mitochondrial distribution and morphology protein 12 n=1 Tax=Aspergillus heteromorphus CBS 117.55 TaxID=1448321 RepID=A0A317W690_9EURO|nr:mitochondrial distribution and morphology protein 12 [Aspergillus heteromorphus CBS 117.55]PWY80528.1 mitochondrial distribution and morphology protein 12 [Aspergillus heteromorphus CBS 117.55]